MLTFGALAASAFTRFCSFEFTIAVESTKLRTVPSFSTSDDGAGAGHDDLAQLERVVGQREVGRGRATVEA